MDLKEIIVDVMRVSNSALPPDDSVDQVRTSILFVTQNPDRHWCHLSYDGEHLG